MPLYEYICEETGDVVELIRPMADADKPVDDPDGKGRRFVRRMSTFAAQSPGSASGRSVSVGGCCPCGKSQGMCGRN